MRPDDYPARYREAALMTLNQLDRCAEYPQRIHKPNLARQLAVVSGAKEGIAFRGRVIRAGPLS